MTDLSRGDLAGLAGPGALPGGALLDALSDLEKTEFESRLYTDYEDQFYWFAGLALLLVLLDVFLIKRKTKWLERLFQ